MSYDIGSHVDLHFLNRKVAGTFQGAIESTEVNPGTSFTFTKEGRAARRIPVAFA